jgi:hypothetical protein
MRRVMQRVRHHLALAAVAVLLVVVWGAATERVPHGAVVAVSARPGPVDGVSQNSDAFLWNLFTQFAAPVDPARRSPVVFETWASDADTFSKTPHWPAVDEPKEFQASVLNRLANPHATGTPIDVPCSPPGNAAVGGFPTSGTPTPCIAEETKRNRPLYDYIVSNGLNTQAGLAVAYAKKFQVVMPTSAIAVKGDWVPLVTLVKWIPSIGSVEEARRLYYTATVDGVEYAVVSLHVSSRQNPNWVWGTFEHQLNPGRCDDLGCFDTFGSTVPAVFPNRKTINSQYGACPKTRQLQTLMARANLAPAWQNYCLKATMVDYRAPDGTPYALGNSVIERIVGNGTVAASSCISCHSYASFGANGKTASAAVAMLPYNPTGEPIPAVLDGSIQFDFMWGVLLAP